MNVYAKRKEGIRVYPGGRKEQVRQRNSGKSHDAGTAGAAEGVYGQLIREFMGTQVDSKGIKLFPAENLV